MGVSRSKRSRKASRKDEEDREEEEEAGREDELLPRDAIARLRRSPTSIPRATAARGQ